MSWVTFNACSCSFRAHTNVTLSTAADGINEEKNDCRCVPHLLLPRTRLWRHTDKPHHSPCSSCMEALRFAVTLESQSCTWLVECCDKQWTLINAVRMIFRDLLSNFSSLSHHFSFFFLRIGGFFLPVRKRSTGSKAPLLLQRTLCLFLPPHPSGRMVSWRWLQEGWRREEEQMC